MAMQKSRSRRRIKVKTTTGRVTIHYRLRDKSKVRCRSCKKYLLGVSSDRKLPKSHKRPSRPYGGNLCSPCTRRIMVDRVIA